MGMDELIRVATAGLALYIVAGVVVFGIALAFIVSVWRGLPRAESRREDRWGR